MIIFDVKNSQNDFEFYKVDIRQDTEIKAVLSHIEKVDILVNNAGVYFEKYIEDTNDDDLDFMIDINLKGTFKVTRNVIDKLCRQNSHQKNWFTK